MNHKVYHAALTDKPGRRAIHVNCVQNTTPERNREHFDWLIGVLEQSTRAQGTPLQRPSDRYGRPAPPQDAGPRDRAGLRDRPSPPPRPPEVMSDSCADQLGRAAAGDGPRGRGRPAGGVPGELLLLGRHPAVVADDAAGAAVHRGAAEGWGVLRRGLLLRGIADPAGLLDHRHPHLPGVPGEPPAGGGRSSAGEGVRRRPRRHRGAVPGGRLCAGAGRPAARCGLGRRRPPLRRSQSHQDPGGDRAHGRRGAAHRAGHPGDVAGGLSG